MTNVEIKSFNDTNIRQKTQPKSITKNNVADALDNIVDYVDGSVVIKTKKFSLNSAEILSLFTTAKELIPAVEGKLYIPQFLLQKYNHVNNAYTTSGQFKLGLGSINFGAVSFSAVITSADNSEGLNTFSYSQGTSGLVYENKALIIGATTANPSGGDGTLDLYISYLEITL